MVDTNNKPPRFTYLPMIKFSLSAEIMFFS